MDEMVSVTFAGPQRPVTVQAPVGASIKVYNTYTRPVQIALPYPNPSDLHFQCKTAGFARTKEVEPLEDESTDAITIAPRGSFCATYYVNRYLSFQQPGKGLIGYRLKMVAWSEAEGGRSVPKEHTFSADFVVHLVEGTDAELRVQLARYAEQLGSDDHQTKMEAAEALAFLGTPLCVEYVARMLEIDNLEVIGICALGRHPCPRSHELIVNALSHPDSAVVGAALVEINRRKISVERERIRDLLTAENPNTRWIALEYLRDGPHRDDLEVVKQLTSDQNEAVRTAAERYLEELEKLR